MSEREVRVGANRGRTQRRAYTEDGDGKVAKTTGVAPINGRAFFPSAKIEVTVDGVRHTERHVDGGVSQALFFRAPFVPPDDRSDVAARDLAGAKVWSSQRLVDSRKAV